MSSLITQNTIKKQIERLDDVQDKAQTAKTNLRAFITSPKFVLEPEPMAFTTLLSVWADSLMTLIEAVGTSFGQANKELPNGFVENGKTIGENGLSKYEQSDLTLVKGIVLAVAVLGSVLLVVYAQVSWVVAALAIAGTFAVILSNQLIGLIQDFLHRDDEDKPDLPPMTDVISESLTYMRRTYEGTLFLIKQQKQNQQRASHRGKNVDDALVDRRAQAAEDLPHDFMNRIDTISVSVNSAVFKCKLMLLELQNGKAPQPVMPQFNMAGAP